MSEKFKLKMQRNSTGHRESIPKRITNNDSEATDLYFK